MTRLSALLASASLFAMAACNSNNGSTSSSTSAGASGTTNSSQGSSSGGTTTGVAVTGTGSGGGNASATTTGGTTTGPAPFKLTFDPTEASTPSNASLPITINIDRDPNETGTDFPDPLQFSLADNPDGGITALFSPNPANADQTIMTLSVAAGVSAADHTINVVASDTVTTSVQSTTGFDVIVSAPATTLLVDNDNSANNADPTDPTAQQSASDALFTTLLGPAPQGVSLPYAYFVVPSDGSGSNTPTFTQLQNYDTVIWYTGANYGGDQPTMSAAQEAVITGWLDTGNKTLIIFSENLVYDLVSSPDWTDPPADNLLANYIGAVGTDVDGATLDHVTYTANGSSLLNSEIYNVVKDTPINSTADRINPGTGVDTLLTVPYDETGSGTALPVPAGVGHYHVGAAGTSTVAYVGIPIEDIQVDGQSESTNLQLFQLVLSYALPLTP